MPASGRTATNYSLLSLYNGELLECITLVECTTLAAVSPPALPDSVHSQKLLVVAHPQTRLLQLCSDPDVCHWDNH